MLRAAGGKRHMRQNACSTAQQHTPSSSSPVSPGLFFCPQHLKATATSAAILQRLFQNTVLRQHVATPFCNTVFFRRSMASCFRHPARPFRGHPACRVAHRLKKANDARSRHRKATFFKPCEPSVLSFYGDFPEPFQRGVQKTSINTNKQSRFLLFI